MNGRYPAAALGPVAILPAMQGQDVGSRLMETGLALCGEMGERLTT